jgi:hypothetical protein
MDHECSPFPLQTRLSLNGDIFSSYASVKIIQGEINHKRKDQAALIFPPNFQLFPFLKMM